MPAAGFVSALLAGLSRPSCWALAKRAGHASPDAMQQLLARARWDHDGGRDDLRDYGVEPLAVGGIRLTRSGRYWSLPRPAM